MQTAIANPVAPPSIERDVAAEMADFMVENPGCTDHDLMTEGGFSFRHIERFGATALAMASRSSVRRIAR